VRLIGDRHRIAAAVTGEVVFLATDIDVVEDDHPDRRFVVALCLCEPEVDPGGLGGPGDQAEVERMARALLIPDAAFDRLVDRPDHGLAAPAWCRRRSKAAATARRRRSLLARPPRWLSSCGTRPRLTSGAPQNRAKAGPREPLGPDPLGGYLCTTTS
jgi:hypothetical protein